jgi:hypothetical protein
VPVGVSAEPDPDPVGTPPEEGARVAEAAFVALPGSRTGTPLRLYSKLKRIKAPMIRVARRNFFMTARELLSMLAECMVEKKDQKSMRKL